MSLLDWLLGRALDDAPMSCHCYRVDVSSDGGRIVMPEKHADWCPAGMTHREFKEKHRPSPSEGGVGPR